MDGAHVFLAPGPHRLQGSWGYDHAFECFWAEVALPGGRGVVRVGVEHLVPTLTGLARVLAARLGVASDDVFVALTHVCGDIAPGRARDAAPGRAGGIAPGSAGGVTPRRAGSGRAA